MWVRREITLEPRPRGFHLVTAEVLAALPEIAEVAVGLLHVFVRHTSASLSLNENASPAVRADMETWASDAVPEGPAAWTHTSEGPDDMPAHVKSGLFGHAVTLPVADGRIDVGTWQGIYLGEHRDRGGRRRLTLTLWGE